MPSIPCDAEGPVFREPWEAQAFAMTLALYDRGCSPGRNGRRRSATRSRRRRPPAIPTPAKPITGTGSTRWSGSWRRKGVADAKTLHRYYHAWDHAADRTPHGQPIELKPSDFHD